MIKILPASFSSLFLLTSFLFSQSKDEKILLALLNERQFVKLDEYNTLHRPPRYYFYKAVYANVCNAPELSNCYLDSLLKVASYHHEDDFSYWRLRNDNYVKLFDYVNAYHTAQILATTFWEEYPPEERQNHLNRMRIWEVLKNHPSQTIDSFQTITVPAHRDLAGLQNVQVTIDGTDADFLFDTGAGVSCVSASMAQKMNLVPLPGSNVKVKGVTGIVYEVTIAIAPCVHIGALTIHHACFMVFEDAALSFGQGSYVINGIIGFPIAKELGTITLEENRAIFSRETLPPRLEKNLFIELLHPVLMLTWQGQTLPYNLDTGAAQSMMSKSFYGKYKSSIDREGTLVTRPVRERGRVKEETFAELQHTTLFLGKSPVIFEKILVDRRHYDIYGKSNYGNIGQDLLRNYRRVVISFDHNYLRLEN